MAYRRVRCNNCRSLLQVSSEAQAIRCPVCQTIIYVQPPVPLANQQYPGGYYVHGRRPNHGYSPQPLHKLPNALSPLVHGKKRAVVCGISYRGQDNYLKSSVSDVRSMQHLLAQRLGFPNASILVLTEDEPDPNRIPTKSNIQRAFCWLVQGCLSGDSLVFYYTGHGARVRDFDGDEMDGYDEALCPVDYHTEGKILDDDINKTIVRPLPFGAKLHGIIDTCFSGTFLDLQFMSRMNREGYSMWEDHRLPYTTYKGTRGGKAICFSACDDHQKSGDTTAFTGNATGAMTFSFIQAVEQEPGLTYGRLLNVMRNKISGAKQGVSHEPQEPQLSSSEKFDIHSEPFTI